ncbi:MAG: serine protease, partial [Acidiferrobacterales bacterium]|nr:serine protease [Acidiferrobacterales bacterium]
MNRTKFALVSLFLLLLNVYPEVSRANDSLRDKVHKQILQIIEDGEYDNSQLSYDSNARNGLPSEPPFIIGGTPTDRNEFPEYTLVIFTDGRGNVTGLCGGTVIASNKVLTAAHCAQNRASTYFLIPGFYSFNDNITATDLKRVSRVIDHPRYSNQSFDFDIAVMTLSQSTSIRPASVIKGGNQLVGKVGEVIGTGLTATSPQPTVPDVLLSVEAPIISNRECSERYLSLTGSNPITSNMVCAGFRDSGKGSCSGDSGGPLYVKTGGGKAIAGVVSFGLRRCEAQRATSAYARTSAFTDFITQQSPNTRFVKPSAVPLAPIYSLLLDNGSSQPEVPGKDPFPEIDPFDQGGFVIKMASGFDDPIGDGHLFEYNPLNSNFEIRRFDPEQGNLEIKWTGWGAQRPVRSDVESWTLRLRMLGRLEVGEFNFNNGLDFSVDAGFFGSCGDRRGRLRIFEIETNAQNELTKLIADFTQKCPRNFGQLRGNINFVKENPPIEFPPRELSGTEPSPSLPELQYAGTIAKLQSQSSPLQDSSIETFDRTNSIISITNYNSRQTSVVIDVRSSDRLGWSLVLERGGLDADPEKGLPLSVGEYKFALNRKQVANTLSFARGSISCGDSIGSFRIYEIEHDLNGVPTKLLADFETDI